LSTVLAHQTRNSFRLTLHPSRALLPRRVPYNRAIFGQEFVRIIWEIAPDEGGSRVDHHPKFVFGYPDFRDGLLSPELMALLENNRAILGSPAQRLGRAKKNSGSVSNSKFKPLRAAPRPQQE
jgi:hypothetical protein